MGETIPTWKPTCNSSVSVQFSNRQTSSDGGALLLREVLDRSGVIEQLDQQLLDSRDPARVVHSLSNQLRSLLIQRAHYNLEGKQVQLSPCINTDENSCTPLQNNTLNAIARWECGPTETEGVDVKYLPASCRFSTATTGNSGG